MSHGSVCRLTARLLGGMTPRPRLCLLENVPGLADKDKVTGRSNLDAVKDAFASQGFFFVYKTFNATDTGIPNNRPRLYMAAVAGLAAEEEADALLDRVVGSLDAMLSALSLDPRPRSEFLLDAYMPDEYTPDDMISDWMPQLRGRRERPATKKALRPKKKAKRGKKNRRELTWAACPRKVDKPRYEADLKGNPWFELLTAREKDVLLLNLCQHHYPGPEDGVVTLMSSMKFSRLVRGAIPCQVPNAIFWLVAQRRLQTGAEALMLQGVDLADIPNFGIGSHPERFLQDLAGNAFCVYQFMVWLLACLPHVPSTSRIV